MGQSLPGKLDADPSGGSDVKSFLPRKQNPVSNLDQNSQTASVTGTLGAGGVKTPPYAQSPLPQREPQHEEQDEFICLNEHSSERPAPRDATPPGPARSPEGGTASVRGTPPVPPQQLSERLPSAPRDPADLASQFVLTSSGMVLSHHLSEDEAVLLDQLNCPSPPLLRRLVARAVADCRYFSFELTLDHSGLGAWCFRESFGSG